MNRSHSPAWSAYLSLFLVAMTTLMFEVLLTRIFSATMWYHYGFLAISTGMFGMTFGAILVYLAPRVFTLENTPLCLALTTFAFALSLAGGLFTQLCIPFYPIPTLLGAFSVAVTVGVIAVPFTFSGMTVALALTKYPEKVGRLYAADLTGAGMGCLFLFWLLNYFDGLSAAVVLSAIVCVPAALYARDAGARRLFALSLACGLMLGVFGIYSGLRSREGRPLLRVMWVKGRIEAPPLFEKWNSYSRIAIHGDPSVSVPPEGWGLSTRFEYKPVPQLVLDIDSGAGTRLTGFTGNISSVDYLRHDVTSVAHYLRAAADVLIVGSGGGRDVLTALAFDQSKVTAVEMNPAIVNAVNGVFGDFTGHLDRDPRVRFVVDEARSYLSRIDNRFDILQISLIDTWAATAAGAFVLSENSLYTVEAFGVYMDRLNDGGILSISRPFRGSNPSQMLRLTTLATRALLDLGAQHPRDHIVIAKSLFAPGTPNVLRPDGVATLLVCRRPFTPEELDRLGVVFRENDFDVILSPREAESAVFAELTDPGTMDAAIAAQTLNIAPPTDESPFFFHMLRFRDVFDERLRNDELGRVGNLKAVYILGILVVVVLAMTALLIVPTMIFTLDRTAVRGASLLILYFAGIGLGFMFVEVSQMQRLIVFLGHPVYGLTVVLFALLISSGLGSLASEVLGRENLRTRGVATLVGLLLVLVVFAVASPRVIESFASATTPVRILLSVALLFPAGFFMGTAFPLGLRAAARNNEALGPFLWGVNGSTSVCASVLATAVSLSSSISTSYWVGFTAYFVAALAFAAHVRRSRLE